MMPHAFFSPKQMFSSSRMGSAWALLTMSFLGYAGKAETYWAKAAASGKTPPNCFVWYADEVGTQGTARVTEAPADGLDGFTTLAVNLQPTGLVILFQ